MTNIESPTPPAGETISASDVALLPCPFCGGIDLSVSTYDVQSDDYHSGYVTCSDCDAEGARPGEWLGDKQEAHAEAIKAWNRRPLERPASKDAIEASGAWTEDMERERREADYERGFRHGKEAAFSDAEAKPVAWRGRDLDAFGDGAWAVCAFKPSCDVVEPLYTHPLRPQASGAEREIDLDSGEMRTRVVNIVEQYVTGWGGEYASNPYDAAPLIAREILALSPRSEAPELAGEAKS